MNYWMTTHWPPKESEQDEVAGGVWLPDGRESAGQDLTAGDRVVIYQTRSGPVELRRTPEGKEKKIRCVNGAEGIIAITKVKGPLLANGRPDPTTYLGRQKAIWWRWFAPVEILTRTGFVPRAEVNNALGYKPGWSLFGFGDRHSGLKRLSEQEYQILADQLNGFTPILLPEPQPASGQSCGIGGGVESTAHRLLKEYVASNPAAALGEPGLKTLAVEYEFGTGDRADCVLSDVNTLIVGVEIEVVVGDTQLAGFLQAIKYRYMLEPLTKRLRGDSRAFLVAHEISKGMRDLCRSYQVEYFVIEKQTVDTWAAGRTAAPRSLPNNGVP
jgi:hypothetical protein